MSLAPAPVQLTRWRRTAIVLATTALVGSVAIVGSIARARMLWREARAETEAGRWDRAEDVLAKLAWYRPRDVEMLRLRAFTALQRGDRDAAARFLGAVPENSPEAASAYLARGQILKELFRLREAEDAFRACVRRDPTQFEAHRQLIIALGVERRGRAQEGQLWALHDQGGRTIEALRMLAQGAVLIPPGALSKTADEGLVLEQALAADPGDPHIRPALARFYRGRGELDRARGLLDPWLQAHPRDTAARLEWLALQVDAGAGATDAARPWFEHPEEPLRSDPAFWALRAEWCRAEGRPVEALASLREAVRLDPRDPSLLYRLAAALRSTGRDDEAKDALARWAMAKELGEVAARVSEPSPDPQLLLQAGRLCDRLGRARESRAWFAAALRRDPSNAEARAALAEVAPPGGRRS